MRRPPYGCSVELQEDRIVVRARLFSLEGYLQSLGVNIFWNGAVSFFALAIFGRLYLDNVGPLPTFYPMQKLVEEFPSDQAIPFALLIIPHIVAGISLLWGLVLRSGGSIEIAIEEESAYVSTGLGPLRWRDRFDPRKVTEIRIVYPWWGRHPRHLKPMIEIVADRRFKFGVLVTDERRWWVQKFLHDLLVGEAGKKKGRGRKRRKSWTTT